MCSGRCAHAQIETRTTAMRDSDEESDNERTPLHRMSARSVQHQKPPPPVLSSVTVCHSIDANVPGTKRSWRQPYCALRWLFACIFMLLAEFGLCYLQHHGYSWMRLQADILVVALSLVIACLFVAGRHLQRWVLRRRTYVRSVAFTVAMAENIKLLRTLFRLCERESLCVVRSNSLRRGTANVTQCRTQCPKNSSKLVHLLSFTVCDCLRRCAGVSPEPN